MRFNLLGIAILSLACLTGCNHNNDIDFADTRPTAFEQMNAAEQAAYAEQTSMPVSQAIDPDTTEVPFSETRNQHAEKAQNIGAL